jgi:hypothetical protein
MKFEKGLFEPHLCGPGMGLQAFAVSEYRGDLTQSLSTLLTDLDQA